MTAWVKKMGTFVMGVFETVSKKADEELQERENILNKKMDLDQFFRREKANDNRKLNPSRYLVLF